jgi:hypothetical protein
MPCTLSAGFLRDCNDAVGGLEEIYLINRTGMTAFTQSNSLVSAITAGTWYKYELKKEVGNIVATTNVDPVNGTAFSEGVCAFSINKFSATKTNELKVMILAQLAVICKDNNGVYWALGFQNFAEGTSLVANTGTAYGDRNGYDITLTAKEPAAPYEVDASVVAGLTIG